MASVLQAVKQQQLTDLEERESRAAFEIATDGEHVDDDEMNARQLKTCLRALGFPATTSAEAKAFIYEFDYKSTHTIGLADFQRIYLFKTRQRSRQALFDEAFEYVPLNVWQAFSIYPYGRVVMLFLGRALEDEHNGSIRLQDLHRNAMTSFLAVADGYTFKRRHTPSRIDDRAFVRCAVLQYYDEDGSEHAIDSFVHSASRTAEDSEYATPEAAARVSREALGAFLRI